jgi:hypothetical protein
MARIFITYRSEDPGWSVALDRELSIVFGPEQVFRASRTMQLGESFPERIRVGIANASVLLAVIGPRWLEPRTDGLRRIDDPDDWVRREIRLALEAGQLVVPVLVDGVRPLVAEELPADVRALAERQYVRLGHKDAEADIHRLIERLQQRVPGLVGRPAPEEPDHRGTDDDAGASGGSGGSGEEEPRAPLWLTLTGLAILLLSAWLPWVDGDPIINLHWTEWSNALILPEGVLIIAALFAATGCLLLGRFTAVAMGVVGVSGLLAIVNPLWLRKELLDDSDSHYQLGAGFLVGQLGGVALLAALAAWAWNWFPNAPRHSNRRAPVVVGGAVIVFAQFLQIADTDRRFMTLYGVVIVVIVLALLAPPRVPEPVRIAALSGFTALAAISVLAAVNYVGLHHRDGASINDPMGRIILNVIAALGLWIALSRPARTT